MLKNLKNNARPNWHYEDLSLSIGYNRVAGIDEAGRGCLAGPVVAAAAVVAERERLPVGITDSKKLTARTREELYRALTESESISWAIGVATAREIDTLNILHATHLAMERAALALVPRADWYLIDGLPIRRLQDKHQAIVDGDAKSISVATASILAKVTRDQMMNELNQRYPVYGFAQHKGYGTKSHLDALSKYGPCPEHRRTFRPVGQLELGI